MSTQHSLAEDLEVTDLLGFSAKNTYLDLRERSGNRPYTGIRYTRENADAILDMLKGRIINLDDRTGMIVYRPYQGSLDHYQLHRGEFLIRSATGSMFTIHHGSVWDRFKKP